MPPTRSEWIIAKREASAPRGMVTADHPAAAEAGLAALRDGGNAVDAAVTAAFVMGVAEPFTSGIGGVACMVVRLPDGRSTVIDGSGLAPREARPDMFALAPGAARAGMYGWPATAGNESNIGYRSIGVPGTLAALALALERHGTRPLASTLEPAIALAADGFEMDPYLAVVTAGCADRLWPHESSARVFFKPGRLPLRPAMGLEPADRLAQPDLARSLELVAREGPDVLYRGELGRRIVADVRAHGGLLSTEDLTPYAARELEPLATDYRDHRVLTVPGAAGGITVVEALNVLDGFALDRLGAGSAEALHLVAEACRRAFLDRLASLGDPDHVDAPFAVLASKEHAARVRALIDERRADPRATPAVGGAPAVGADVPHTTHICAMDERGMAVSLTTTLGGAFGSGVVAGDTGILLGNVMTWFDPRPGLPNSIAPGKRILWAVAPAVLERDGRARLVVGAPGGRKLISAVLQTIVNVVDFGDGPQAAVDRPRVHAEGPETWIEARVPEEVRARLAAMGHELVVREETLASSWFGRPNAILVDEDGTRRGGVNRMKSSMAAGF